MFKSIKIKQELPGSFEANVYSAVNIQTFNNEVKQEIKAEKKDCQNCGDSLILSNIKREDSSNSEIILPNLKKAESLESCRCSSSASSYTELNVKEKVTPRSLFYRDFSQHNYNRRRPKRRPHIHPWNRNLIPVWNTWYKRHDNSRYLNHSSFLNNLDNQVAHQNHYNYLYYRNYARDNYRRKIPKEEVKHLLAIKKDEDSDDSASNPILLRITNSSASNSNEKSLERSNTSECNSRRKTDDDLNAITSCSDAAEIHTEANESSRNANNVFSSYFVENEDKTVPRETQREDENIDILGERFVIAADVIAHDDLSNNSNFESESSKIVENECGNLEERIEPEFKDSDDIIEKNDCTIDARSNEGKSSILQIDSLDILDRNNAIPKTDDISNEFDEPSPKTNQFFDEADDTNNNFESGIGIGSEENAIDPTSEGPEGMNNLASIPKDKSTISSDYSQELDYQDVDIETEFVTIDEINDECDSDNLLENHDHDLMVIEEIQKNDNADISVISEIRNSGGMSVLNYRKEKKFCKKCFLKWRNKKKQKRDIIFLGTNVKTVPVIDL